MTARITHKGAKSLDRHSARIPKKLIRPMSENDLMNVRRMWTALTVIVGVTIADATCQTGAAEPNLVADDGQFFFTECRRFG